MSVYAADHPIGFAEFRDQPDFKQAVCVAVSSGLSNVKHKDERDSRPSVARWVRAQPNSRGANATCWFLAPEHSLDLSH